MFFVFTFLMLSIYVSETNNFVLNKISQGDGQQTDKDLIIFQDIQNDSSVFPTRKSVYRVIHNHTKTRSSKPKLKKFDEKLSDIVPKKRHIQENYEDDPPSIFKSTKSSITTSTLALKRKWPVVELLSRSDDFKENSQYFDEFEKKEFPFIHDIENESKVTEIPPKIIHSYLDMRNNHSKDKPVGLRSLPQEKFPGISCEDGDACVCKLPPKTGKTSPKCFTNNNKCTRTTIVYTLVNFYVPYELVNVPTGTPRPTTTTKATTTRPPSSTGLDFENFPMGIPVGVPMGVPMGVPIPAGYPPGYPMGYPPGYPVGYPPGYPAGPVVCAPGSPCYYQPNINEEVPKHKKPYKTEHDDLYYDDDDEDDDDEDVCVYDEDSKKRKHEKKHKGDILIDVDYDIGERKPNKHYKCQDRHEDLATDIFNDIRKSYGDTVIKNCYCCSASSSSIEFKLVFLLLILDVFC